MKKILFLSVLFSVGFVCAVHAQTDASPVDKVIKFSKEKHDLGTIKYKEKTTFFLDFSNISNKPVVIENVMVGCGCTVAEKPNTPILPGKQGKIKVGYDGTAAPGSQFSKDVTIKVAGIPTPKTIIFTGKIAE